MHQSTLMAFGIIPVRIPANRRRARVHALPMNGHETREKKAAAPRNKKETAQANRERFCRDIAAIMQEGISSYKQIYLSLLYQGKIPIAATGSVWQQATCERYFKQVRRTLPPIPSMKSLIIADYMNGCHNKAALAKKHGAALNYVRSVIYQHRKMIGYVAEKTITQSIIDEYKGGCTNINTIADRCNTQAWYVRRRLIRFGYLKL